MMKLLNSYTISLSSLLSINIIDLVKLSYIVKFSGQSLIGIMTIIYLYYQIKKIRHDKEKK